MSSRARQHVRPELVEYTNGVGGWRDAAAYDAIRYAGPVNAYKQALMAGAYEPLVGRLDRAAVLDIGCGTGRGLAAFARRARWAVGADASHDMLRAARGKMDDRADGALVRSMAQALPFADASFDVVTSLNFLHLFSLDTQRRMVTEAKRVLKPGGILVLEFDNALQGAVLGTLKRWLRAERGSFPWEIARVLGDGLRVLEVRGAVLPVVWRWFHRAPRAFARLERLAYRPPLNRFAHRIYYKARKL